MNAEIDLNRLVRSKLDANQYIILYLIYHKNFKLAKELFGAEKALNIRNSLINTKYMDDTGDVTPDGKYLIFARRNNWDFMNIYWIEFANFYK